MDERGGLAPPSERPLVWDEVCARLHPGEAAELARAVGQGAIDESATLAAELKALLEIHDELLASTDEALARGALLRSLEPPGRETVVSEIAALADELRARGLPVGGAAEPRAVAYARAALSGGGSPARSSTDGSRPGSSASARTAVELGAGGRARPASSAGGRRRPASTPAAPPPPPPPSVAADAASSVAAALRDGARALDREALRAVGEQLCAALQAEREQLLRQVESVRLWIEDEAAFQHEAASAPSLSELRACASQLQGTFVGSRHAQPALSAPPPERGAAGGAGRPRFVDRMRLTALAAAADAPS